MRDVVMFGLAPSMIKRPAIGAVVLIWISLVDLHWLAYGPAYGFPMAMLAGAITIIVYCDSGRSLIAELFASPRTDSATLRQATVLDAAGMTADCGTDHARS